MKKTTLLEVLNILEMAQAFADEGKKEKAVQEIKHAKEKLLSLRAEIMKNIDAIKL